jgi:hypothetical protein
MKKQIIFAALAGLLFSSCLSDPDMGRQIDTNVAGGVTFVVSAPVGTTDTHPSLGRGVAGGRNGESGQINNTIAATRVINEGGTEDNRIDELVVMIFDQDGNWIERHDIGRTGEPVIAGVEGDIRRKQFRVNGLKDGSYRALFVANSRAEIDDYIEANGADADRMTIDAFREGLMVDHVMSSSNRWNADPADNATDDGDGVYRPFPMSSREVVFAVPSNRDWLRQPVELRRALAKINVRSQVPNSRFRIKDIMVCNYNSDGAVIPAPSLTGVAQAGTVTLVRSNGIHFADVITDNVADTDLSACVDEIFLYEQSSYDPATLTPTDWGMSNVCMLIKADVVIADRQFPDACFRVDLLRDHDNDPATNPRHIDLMRNYRYDITITDVNTAGYDEAGAYTNPPSGLVFDVTAHNESADGNENVFNSTYQLTTDRSVIVIGPEAGDTATVKIFTDYAQGWEMFVPQVPSTSQKFTVSTDHTTSANSANFPPVTVTFTVPAALVWNGNTIRSTSFMVRAGELVKQMTLVQLPRVSEAAKVAPSSSVTDYVGAFWRADQTGERIVSIKPGRKWSAWVLDSHPGGTGDWVVMDANPSTDAGVGTTLPIMSGNDTGFDSRHNVSGGDIWAEGTTDDYEGGCLRLGARNQFAPSTGAAARYAAVLIVDNSSTAPVTSRLLFLRQGHAPDYVMGQGDDNNGDPITPVDGKKRPMARRVSPYNLTANAFKTDVATEYVSIGRPTESDYSGGFTDYPSQAGALFKWFYTYNVRAINPTHHSAGYDSQTPDAWHHNDFHYETCPPGYHRPSDGRIDLIESGPGLLSRSEMFQSLMSSAEDGPANNTGNTDNSVWGMYADGFFDRRAISDGVTVGTRSSIACQGRLFYNPATLGSVFLPASGSLAQTSAPLKIGEESMYWTTTTSDTPNWGMTAMSLHISGNDANRHIDSNKSDAYPVRCVVNEGPLRTFPLAPPGVIGIRESDLLDLERGYKTPGDGTYYLTLRGSSTYRGSWVENIATRDPNLGSLENEPVYMVYFKWGSTVAVLPGINGSDFDASRDVAWKPVEAPDISSWADIPTSPGTLMSSGRNGDYDIVTDRSKGWGDPCDEAGGIIRSNVPSGWRTPMGKPWRYSDGTTETATFGTVNYPSWADARAQGMIGNWTWDFGGGAYTDDGKVFLPLSGSRTSTGTCFNGNIIIEHQDMEEGNYWSATHSDHNNYTFTGAEDRGYHLQFSYGRVITRINSLTDKALAVRCVRPSATNLVHAAPGVIGIKRSDLMALRNGTKVVGDGSYSLTIKGSSYFRGSWVETMSRSEGEFPDRGQAGLENEPVYTVYFKWGSLVAMIGGGSWKENGSNVVWVNPEYNGPTKGPYGSGTPFSPAATKGTPETGYNVIENLPRGHGDPCQFIEKGNNMWMTPPGNPWKSPVLSYNGSTTPFGYDNTHANYGTGGVRVVMGSTNTTPSAPYYLPGLSMSAMTPDQQMYLPAAGYYWADRANNVYGLMVNVAATGMYWTSTAMDGDNGSHISFNGIGSTAAASSDMNNGFPIRCVPVDPYR